MKKTTEASIRSLVSRYQDACRSIQQTRDDPGATAIMISEGWAILGSLLVTLAVENVEIS